MMKVLYGDLSHRLKLRMMAASRFRSIDEKLKRTINRAKFIASISSGELISDCYGHGFFGIKFS